MATVITTLTGVETKLGGEGDEAWTLYRFTGTVDGQEKVFQTFDDDLAQLIQRDFMRQPIALEFEVETRTYTAKQGLKKG